MIAVDLRTSKRNFFDRAAVMNRMNKAERKVLSKFGAFVRRQGQKNIRFSKTRTSKPGKSPYAHTKDKFASLRNILFSFDPYRRSVVIGPVKFNQKQYVGIDRISGTVPQVMEHGGSVGLREKQRSPGGRWGSMGRRRILRPGERTRVRSVTYQARPFMAPAFKKVSDESLPQMWKDAA